MNTPRQATDLHLLQVSDCHLYADPKGSLLGLNTLDAFREVLRNACEQHRPDMIIVTGDVVHDGSKKGYKLFADSLHSTGCRSAAIPGNHDNLMNMRKVLEKRHIPTSGTVDMGDWRLVLLNSQVPGKEHGHLSWAELALLDQALMDPPPHVLIFLHHQPVPVGSEWLDNIGLTNARDLLDRVQNNPAVKGIVWGHVHQPWEGGLKHIKLLATPSTCIQFAQGQDGFGLDNLPPGWRSLTLGKDGALSTHCHHLSHMPAGLIADSAGY